MAVVVVVVVVIVAGRGWGWGQQWQGGAVGVLTRELKREK